MDKNEFAAWKAETKKSETNWVFDRVMQMNSGDCLWYKGGEDGVFILAVADGTVSIGNYEGAIPSITDALFRTSYSRKTGDDLSSAVKVALEGLGFSGLMAMMYG